MNTHQRQLQMSEHDEIEKLIDQYVDSLFRLCYTILKNRMDAEDAVSETLMKYYTKAPVFIDEKHRKSWLIRVASNICKDILRTNRYRKHLDLNEVYLPAPDNPDSDILATVLRLPEKDRTVIYLHYLEGYSTAEIAGILSISTTAVRKRLQHARSKLKLEYERED